MNVEPDNLFIANSMPVGRDYPQHLQRILSLDRVRGARQALGHFSRSTSTPLLSLQGIAAQCRVGSILYKDESQRLGLNSFKALGAPYAMIGVAKSFLRSERSSDEFALERLIAGEYSGALADLCVAAATDGNHGTALAWVARQFGCRCRIYLHRHAPARLDRHFDQLQAEVVRVAGNYDDSVARCQMDAEPRGHVVVADTAYAGYQTIPRQVMEGYAVLCLEAFEQLSAPPTHIFVQAGVGSLAAAVLAAFWARYNRNCPRGVIVEPASAACLYASGMRKQLSTIGGEHATVMDGLACGVPSTLAWEILSEAATAFLKIDDQQTVDAVETLTGQSVSVGPSGSAGLAGLQQVAQNESYRSALGIDADSRVFLIGTEAAK